MGNDGDRFIAFDDDTAVGLPDDLDLDLVREARVLLLDAYNPAEGIRAAAAARAAGVAVVAVAPGLTPTPAAREGMPAGAFADVVRRQALPREL